MVDRPGRVSIRGAGVPMNVADGEEQQRRFPGEPAEGRSEQMQSWVDAGEGFSNWLQSAGSALSQYGGYLAPFIPTAGNLMNFRDRFNETVYGLGDAYNRLTEGRASERDVFGGMSPSRASSAADAGVGEIPEIFTDSGAAAEMMQQPQAPSFEELLAQYQFDGSPYDQAADYMQERRAAQMRAIQDMYNQYAAETQANVDRIADIYGGAEAGIGETYEGATGAIEQAYGSAQQQAADQLARLGIEEAAPAVVNPMALSQAETLANLETGRAGSLGATQQFGATAGGFASDMATVAQQQALENQRSITDQLADQLFELEMQRAEAQQAYNPYQRLMQELETRQAYENLVNPPVDTSAADEAMRNADEVLRDQFNIYLEGTTNYDQDAALRRTVIDAARGLLTTEAQQKVLTDPRFAPFLPEEMLG